jgi:hypothetical protein
MFQNVHVTLMVLFPMMVVHKQPVTVPVNDLLLVGIVTNVWMNIMVCH